MVIAGAALSAFCLGLQAANAHSGHSPSEPQEEGLCSSPAVAGSQDVLVVPPDAPGRPVYSVFTGLNTFLATGKETGGQFSLFDLVIPPQTVLPPQIHSREDQAFYILDGDLTLQLGNQTTVATPGTFVYLPKDRPQGFQNLGMTPVHMLLLTTPSGFEGFLTEEGNPVTDRSNPPAPPQDLSTIAPIASKYGIQLALPPESSGNTTTESSGNTPMEGLLDYLVVPPDAERPSFNGAGGLYTSLATGEETGGHLLLFDISLPPQAGSGWLQSNVREAQSFYVLEGEVKFWIGDKTTVGTPGTFVYLPKGTPYAFRNLGTTPARTLSLRIPACDPKPSSGLSLWWRRHQQNQSLLLQHYLQY